MSIEKIISENNYGLQEIAALLSAKSKEDNEAIRKAAYNTMLEYIGYKVSLRGLLEFSNVCINDCFYCGIRKSNQNIKRYTLDAEEIINSAKLAAELGFGSVVLQSGERQNEPFISLIEYLVKEIKKITKSSAMPDGLGITLCAGEQSKDTYKRFFDAGAHRYLLRIESSSEELYKKIHPANLSYKNRLECLENLKEIGFQTGTGVMIGLPGQTTEDLARDIIFFRDFDADMIGMGPFIVHHQTPYGSLSQEYQKRKEEIFRLAMKMLAVTRLVLKDVNIASTTALQAMYPAGREEGLMHGANVIMPNITPGYARNDYQLYDGKPCTGETLADCFGCILKRIRSTGREAALFEYGDSPHFLRKK